MKRLLLSAALAIMPSSVLAWELAIGEGMCTLVHEDIFISEEYGLVSINFEKFEKFDLNGTKVFGFFEHIKGIEDFGTASYGFASFEIPNLKDVTASGPIASVLITVDGDDSYWFYFPTYGLRESAELLDECNAQFSVN